MEKVYYYKTVDGKWHFSTGITKDDAKAGEYLRLLKKLGKEPYKLYLDIPSDFNKAKKVFGLPIESRWQDIYYSK